MLNHHRLRVTTAPHPRCQRPDAGPPSASALPHRASLVLPLVAGLVAGLAMGLAPGCASNTSTSSGSSTPSGPETVLSPADFDSGVPTPPPAQPSAPPRQFQTRAQASEGVLDVSGSVGGPALPTEPVSPMATLGGRPITVDAVVGQINGVPVRASEFLDPLDPRLSALKREFPRITDWQRETTKILAESIQQKIRDEFLLAEAYSSLTPEVRQEGLRVFLDQIRGQIVRGAEGSRELAEERLQEAEGLGVDQKAKERMEQALISEHLRRTVLPRVVVSTREQRLFYEKNFARFNPPATARLRLVSVDADDPQAVSAIESALAAGRPFVEIAALDANLFSENAGLREVVLKQEYSKTDLLGQDALNEPAWGLKPGETAGPLDFRRRKVWVHLEEIDQPPGRSFYDAQLEVYNALYQMKLEQETRREIQRLLGKSSVTPVERMVSDLLAMATDRHWGGATGPAGVQRMPPASQPADDAR